MNSMPIDLDLNRTDEIRFRNKNRKFFKELLPKTHFTYNELETLMIIYYKFQRKIGKRARGVSMAQFHEILHIIFDITDDYLFTRIIAALEKGANVTGFQRFLSMKTWAYMMSLYIRGTLDEKIEYCFNVYNPIGTGFIVKEVVVKYCLVTVIRRSEEESDEAIRDMADIILRKFDLDRDGRISFKDYQTTVKQNPSLLEVFGPCLPTRESIRTFLTTFTTNIKNI